MYGLEEDLLPYAGVGAFKPMPLAQMDADARKEYWATLALKYSTGIGLRTLAKLLKNYGSANLAMENSRQWQSLGIPQKCQVNIANNSWRARAKTEWDSAAESDINILLWDSPDYPAMLRQLTDAPALLYCSGDLELLKSPAIAIVGSRGASDNSRRIARSLARSMSECGITVVSGMAMGIDRQAHIAALDMIGKSIGVLGAGINVRYPSSNRDLYDRMQREGLLVSEFYPSAPPAAANFPVRNRIISGLSIGVVVVEAALRSGSLITARLALEQNREVFAVPGMAFDERSMGCQNLVRQGAHSVFGPDDILGEIADSLKAWQINVQSVASGKKTVLAPPDLATGRNRKPAVEFSDPEARQAAINLAPDELADRLVRLLEEKGACHVDEIAWATGLSPDRLSPLLLSLEMLGRINRLPGARYEANNDSA